jgi:hypothetical protein
MSENAFNFCCNILFPFFSPPFLVFFFLNFNMTLQVHFRYYCCGNRIKNVALWMYHFHLIRLSLQSAPEEGWWRARQTDVPRFWILLITSICKSIFCVLVVIFYFFRVNFVCRTSAFNHLSNGVKIICLAWNVNSHSIEADNSTCKMPGSAVGCIRQGIELGLL